MSASYRIVVLISGSGTNLQAILDDLNDDAAINVVAVISDKEAAGLERARRASVPADCIAPQATESRHQYDQRLAGHILRYKPDLVVLAGFMRILDAEFVRAFAERLINIHPSLLPAYRGLHTHRRVLAAGETWHGTTVHAVTAELDAGPSILQGRVRIKPDDDEASLSARIQALEHTMYPRVIRWFASGRLSYREGAITLDGKALHEPVIISETES